MCPEGLAFYTSGFCTFTEWVPDIIMSCQPEDTCPYLGPPENRITFLNSIVMLDAFYSSWFLLSTTAHTPISSSYPSLRHTPLACPQARSSCGSHILFYHRVFLKFENKDREVTYAMGREIHESANLRFINFSRKFFLFLKYMPWI